MKKDKDYAVYKKIEDEEAVAVKVFRKSKYGSTAKFDAYEYFRHLYSIATSRKDFENLRLRDLSFEYDKKKTLFLSEHIKFYIGEYKEKKPKNK